MNIIKNSYFIEYYEKCLSKEIIIGNELLTALKSLYKDLQNDYYVYDIAESHKRIKFIESECKHSISPFAGMPFILELWEKALVEVIFSFKINIENKILRRFTRVLLLCGRKNGKSTFTSSLALSDFYCGNKGVNVLVASNTDDQTNILFNEINNMREESNKLAKTSRKNLKGIFMGNAKQINKKGKFSYQNKAQIKKLTVRTGAKEGRNVDLSIMDETHEFKNDDLFMSLWQSMSTKDEPLLIEITTEGFTQEGHLDLVLKDARQILRGEKINDRFLIWLYTQDSEAEIWTNRESWYKANPSLGVCKKWNYLDELVEQSKTNSSIRSFMLAKDFNIKQSSSISWLQPEIILNESIFDLEEFKNCYCIVGVDLATTTDLTAITFLFKKENDKINYLFSHYFIPSSKLLTNTDDGSKYEEWQKGGYITVVEDNSLDVSFVADYIHNIYEKYNIIPYKVGYDNKFSKDFINKYKSYFGNTEKDIYCVYQDAKTLDSPMRKLEADFRDKLVNYDNNPVSFWCYCNTGFKIDNMEKMQPAKVSRNRRIDGTASAVIVYKVFNDYKSEFLDNLNI